MSVAVRVAVAVGMSVAIEVAAAVGISVGVRKAVRDGVSVGVGVFVCSCVGGVSVGVGPLQAKLRNIINTARHPMIRQVTDVLVEATPKRPATDLRSLLPLPLSRFIILPRGDHCHFA